MPTIKSARFTWPPKPLTPEQLDIVEKSIRPNYWPQEKNKMKAEMIARYCGDCFFWKDLGDTQQRCRCENEKSPTSHLITPPNFGCTNHQEDRFMPVGPYCYHEGKYCDFLEQIDLATKPKEGPSGVGYCQRHHTTCQTNVDGDGEGTYRMIWRCSQCFTGESK